MLRFTHSTTFLLLILLIGLVLRLVIAWQSVPLLVEKTIPDDAFYYFVLARNVVSGKGVSVDGTTPTNGFHPLWAGLLLIPYSLLRDGDTPIHVSLSLAALIDMLSAVIAFDLVRRVTNRPEAGLLASLLYAFHPLVAMESQNGLETALATLMFALTTWVYLIRVRRPQASYLDYALLGIAAGLMLLARTDSLFLLLLIGIDGLGRLRISGASQVKGWVLAGLLIVLLLLPWLWWNLTTFGAFVQSSAVAAPRVIRYSLTTTPQIQGEPLASVIQDRYLPILILSLILGFRYAGLALSTALVALILTRLLTGRFPPLREIGILGLPFLGAALPVFVHTFVRWYPRSWYYVPLAWTAAVVGGAIIDQAVQLWPQNNRLCRYLRIGGVTLLLLLLASQGIKMWQEGYYPWQRHMLTGARWAADAAPPNAIIASFNSGLQAYYSQHPIVNLDGVVNWEAIKAMEQRRLLAYVRGRGATYLVDYQAYIFNTFYPFFEEGYETSLQPVIELSPEYPPYGTMGVYQIK
jgi:hypothetical protein